MTLKRFIPVDRGRNDVMQSGGCSPPVKKIMRGALNNSHLISSPLVISLLSCVHISFSLHATVKMSKPFNPEEAENLEDVRPRVHMVYRPKNFDR